MSLIGRTHLAAVPDVPSEPVESPELTAFTDLDDDEHSTGGGLDHGTPDELRAQNAFLLGVIVQRDVRDLADRYRGGHLSPSEKERLTARARDWWADRAAYPEHIDPAVDRARAVGRGEVTA